MKSRRFHFDPEKALNLVLYVARAVPQATFHTISKVIYFADKLHLQRYGRLICGDSYVAMKHGPVPSEIYDMMKDVRGDGFSEHWPIAREAFQVKEKATVVPSREPDLTVFSDSDRECLEESIKTYGHLNFARLTELSHDAAWEATDDNDMIDIEQIIATFPDSSALLQHLRAS
jgi:uncharacterized phage-associated protein